MSDVLFAPEARDLVRDYLDHAYRIAEPGMASPCSNFLALVRNTHPSLDSLPISLGVAVEGVAKLIEFTPPSNKTEHDILRLEIKKWLKEKKFSEGLAGRVTGMLGGLDHARPIDSMMSLAPAGRLLRSDITTWRDLRNQAVHTRESKPSDSEHDNSQRQLDTIHVVGRLLYTLIFHLIDYRGAFADLGAHDFPSRNYPFEPEAAKSDGKATP